jgi:hypothetical protein
MKSDPTVRRELDLEDCCASGALLELSCGILLSECGFENGTEGLSGLPYKVMLSLIGSGNFSSNKALPVVIK